MYLLKIRLAIFSKQSYHTLQGIDFCLIFLKDDVHRPIYEKIKPFGLFDSKKLGISIENPSFFGLLSKGLIV